MTTLVRIPEQKVAPYELARIPNALPHAAKPQKPAVPGPVAVSAEGAADLLGISKRGFENAVKRGDFHPGHCVGKSRRWEVQRLIEDFRRLPTTPSL